MLINLAFINAVNGLFYFATDYIAELQDSVSVVIVRSPALETALRKRFPDIVVRVVTLPQTFAEVWNASRRGEMVFTPSSHPIPWCDRQMVVVHDTFPFEGAKGAVKAALFWVAMRTSRTVAGYINVSDARAFLVQRVGLESDRIIASPNHVARAAPISPETPLIWPAQPRIGLFGTDSPKKNYEALFQLVAAGRGSHLKFKVYGQPNSYILEIIRKFPMLDIEFSSSGDIDLEPFLRSVDILVSAATCEGFSRPSALALSLGIPCWLIDAPVFREFYGGAAMFHQTLAALADTLIDLKPGACVERPEFSVPTELERSFRACIDWLKNADGGSR